MIVTIDGPAASGKSSVSRLLAAQLKCKWVSTGAFYRGLAYVAFEKGVSASDEAGLVRLAKDPMWSVAMGLEKTHVYMDGEDVTEHISHEDVGSFASTISRHPGVRASLLAAQRACAKPGESLVAEGRDCGTVVFPQAEVKIFLTAASADRAARRASQQGLSVETTEAAQRQRDDRDTNRKAAPLQVPEGGHVIDTSGYTLLEVVAMALALAKRPQP